MAETKMEPGNGGEGGDRGGRAGGGFLGGRTASSGGFGPAALSVRTPAGGGDEDVDEGGTPASAAGQAGDGPLAGGAAAVTASRGGAGEPVVVPLEEDVWLHAWHDPLAGLHTHKGCVRLVDLTGDGDVKLLVATQDRRLRVFRGTALSSTQPLLDQPSAVCVFYPDMATPRTPALAVASGPHVFMYRNLHPYLKFTVPEMELPDEEKEVWHELKQGSMDAQTAFDTLASARDNGIALSSRSVELLALEEEEQREQYVDSVKAQPFKQLTVVTCMEVLRKDSEDEQAVGSLVLGTESSQVLILDSMGEAILCKVDLPSPPAFMAVTGMFEIEWRIVIAARNGMIYTVKNGEVRGSAVFTGNVIEPEAHPCALAREGKNILVALMNRQLVSYTIKGKKNFSITMPAAITEVEPVVVRRARTVTAVLVALETGEVRMYQGKDMVCMFRLPEPVVALRFGPYGREHNSLIAVQRSGAITVKMLRRSAKLDPRHGVSSGPPPEQDVPLNVPRKTKLYVEQTQREREQPGEMHRVFQRDLCRLRLQTVRAYVRTITHGQVATGNASSSGGANGGASLRVHAEVSGLGPRFRIRVVIQNTGSRPVMNAGVRFTFDDRIYTMEDPTARMATLIPGVKVTLDRYVTCVDELGSSDVIRVMIMNPSSAVPFVTASVAMPKSELLEPGS